MEPSQNSLIIWYLLALLLVGSALINQRLSLRSGLGMAMLWIGIFIGVAAAYSQRGELAAIFNRSPAASPSDISSSNGPPSTNSDAASSASPISAQILPKSLKIPMSDNGHYFVDGSLNGHMVRFMIDSGATVTAIPEKVAREAGLNVEMSGPGVAVQTANGAAMARRSSVAQIAVGPITATDMEVLVAPGLGEMGLLGANFLSKLKRWRVENGEMVLEQ